MDDVCNQRDVWQALTRQLPKAGGVRKRSEAADSAPDGRSTAPGGGDGGAPPSTASAAPAPKRARCEIEQ